MRKLAAAALAVLTLAGSTLALPPAAIAIGGSSDCTLRQFHRVDRHDTLTKARRVFGGRGHVEWIIGSSKYRTWGRPSTGWCGITFTNRRVSDKDYSG